MNKRIIKIAGLMLVVWFSGNAMAAETITVAATEYPNGEILKVVQPMLAKQGYNLVIKNYLSYSDPAIVFPNGFLSQKQGPNMEVMLDKVDANFFEHIPYLNQFTVPFHDLKVVKKVFYVPYAIYVNPISQGKVIKTHKLPDITNGASVGIPGTALNQGRALKLLAAASLITLNTNEENPTVNDILTNPYKLNIYPMDSNVLQKMLADKRLDMIVMNSGQATHQSGAYLSRAVYIESQNATYANVLVTRDGVVNSPKIKALASALTSPEVKQYIAKNYHGEVIPSF